MTKTEAVRYLSEPLANSVNDLVMNHFERLSFIIDRDIIDEPFKQHIKSIMNDMREGKSAPIKKEEVAYFLEYIHR